MLIDIYKHIAHAMRMPIQLAYIKASVGILSLSHSPEQNKKILKRNFNIKIIRQKKIDGLFTNIIHF